MQCSAVQRMCGSGGRGGWAAAAAAAAHGKKAGDWSSSTSSSGQCRLDDRVCARAFPAPDSSPPSAALARGHACPATACLQPSLLSPPYLRERQLVASVLPWPGLGGPRAWQFGSCDSNNIYEYIPHPSIYTCKT